MNFAEDLTPYFADFGGPATLNGVAVTAIVDTETVFEVNGVASQKPTAVLATSAASAAAPGQSFVAGGLTYSVREVLREPPDGVFTRLVLAR